jgi:hypothetical protein
MCCVRKSTDGRTPTVFDGPMEVPMHANVLSIRVDSQTTMDAVPVLVDAVLTLEFPVARRVAHASLSDMITSSTLAALLHDAHDNSERLRTGVGSRAGRPVRDAQIVHVCIPPNLQAHNDACLLAALADVRRRYAGARHGPPRT